MGEDDFFGVQTVLYDGLRDACFVCIVNRISDYFIILNDIACMKITIKY